MNDNLLYINGRKELSVYSLSLGAIQAKKVGDWDISLSCQSPSAQVYRVTIQHPDKRPHTTYGAIGPMRRLWRDKINKAEESCSLSGT
jgi:hypothetical protein